MPQEFRSSSPELQKAIRRRAAELYRQTGSLEGRDVENSGQAEAESLRETAARRTSPAVLVSVEGVVHTGEYELSAADGYEPGEWEPGDRVPVLLRGEKLHLRRRNGRELETTGVRRID